MVLSTSRDEAFTESLVNIFQCPTTLTVKNFSLIPNLNLFSFSLKPLSLFLWLHALVNSLYLFCGLPPVTGRPPWSFLFSSWVNLILSAFPPSRSSSSLWSACWPPLDFFSTDQSSSCAGKASADSKQAATPVITPLQRYRSFLKQLFFSRANLLSESLMFKVMSVKAVITQHCTEQSWYIPSKENLIFNTIFLNCVWKVIYLHSNLTWSYRTFRIKDMNAAWRFLTYPTQQTQYLPAVILWNIYFSIHWHAII